MVRRWPALTLGMVMTFGVFLAAQDANHWTQQYGAYATLLGGAVIGSPSGLASTYYNPGRLSLSDSATVVVSAKAYQLTSLRLVNSVGGSGEVKNDEIGGSPDLVAGFLPSRKLGPGRRLAYSILHRYAGSFDLTFRSGANRDALPGVAGEEAFAGELQFNYKVNDFWAGVSFSQRLNDHIGVGVTQFVSIRSQRFNRRIFYEALLEDGRTATASRFQEYDYFKASLVWRAGLSGNFGPGTTWGLSVTTPYLNLFGSGYVLYNELVAGGDLTGNGLLDDLLISNQQDGQPARYRTGWAFGAGASTLLSSIVRVHFSTEYFTSVGRYALIEADPFQGQSTGEEQFHRVDNAQRGVLNAGLGFEFFANENVDYYASFSTDFSPILENEALVNTYLGTNLYHLGGGTTLSLGRVDLNLGLIYSFGNEAVPDLTTIFLPPGWRPDDEAQPGDLRWRRIKLIFGISVN